ncbi:hypothetical protein C0J52_13141 [Blattella germanica]|nr:hypothetical protein C0J52_13141 [Blattella germanica]
MQCPSQTERMMCADFPPHETYPCKNMTGGGEFLSLAFYGKNDTYLECPTKTGKFHLIGLEPDLVSRPILQGYYVLTNKGYLHGKQVMCYMFDVSVEYWMEEVVAGRTRKRPKKKSH